MTQPYTLLSTCCKEPSYLLDHMPAPTDKRTSQGVFNMDGTPANATDPVLCARCKQSFKPFRSLIADNTPKLSFDF